MSAMSDYQRAREQLTAGTTKEANRNHGSGLGPRPAQAQKTREGFPEDLIQRAVDPDVWADELFRQAEARGFPHIVIKGSHLGAIAGPGPESWRRVLRGLGHGELADVAGALEAWRS